MQTLQIPTLPVSSNFFNDYHCFSKGTEPPDTFHFWSSVYAVSTVLGRKTALTMGPLKFFPQLYVVIVGPPATRKSTAIDMAQKLVAEINKINFAPSSLSREALIDSLANEKAKVNVSLAGKVIPYHQVACFASELSEFLGGKHLNESIIRFLTDIWDRDVFKEQTRKGGEVVINSPYFTIIGACTKDWIGRSLASDIITDGFARRVIFIYDDVIKCIPWPTQTPEQVEARNRAKAHLERMFTLKGFFTMSREAFDHYNGFYNHNRETMNTRPPMMQNYYSSKHTIVLKLAMCISAGIRNDLLIDSGCLRAAMTILEQTEEKRDSIFTSVGRNPTSVAQDNMVKFLENEKAKRARKSTLLARFLREFRDINEFEGTLRAMVEAGTLSEHCEVKAEGRVVSEYCLLASVRQLAGSNPFEATAVLSPLDEEPVGLGLATPLEVVINQAAAQGGDEVSQLLKDFARGVIRLGKRKPPARTNASPPDSKGVGDLPL